MYTYFRPFRVITLNPAAKAIFLTVSRMNLVRKREMSVDPINVYRFSTNFSYQFKFSRKSHFLTVSQMNLVRKQKISVDPINVYLFSSVLSYHFRSCRKNHFFNRQSDEFGQKAKNVR